MTKLKTATGKEFDTGYFVERTESKALYVRISNERKETVETVFSDPSETQTLFYNGNVFEGYTILGYVIDEGDAIKLRLKRGDGNAINNDT